MNMNWKDKLCVAACLLFLIGLLYVAAHADVPATSSFNQRFTEAAHADFDKTDESEELPKLKVDDTNALDCTDEPTANSLLPIRRASDKRRMLLDFCTAAEDIRYVQVSGKKGIRR